MKNDALVPGAGLGVGGLEQIIELCRNISPLLHVIATTVTIIVGVLTAIWTAKKIWGK